MKLPKLHRLNSLGITHLLVPLLAIIVIGGIGSYLITASHADPVTSLVQCKAGKTSSGKTVYFCSFATPAPLTKASVANGGGGTFYKSSYNYIYCQTTGSEAYRTVSGTTYRNHYWGFTISDQNHYGWVSAVYAHTGNNDQGFGYLSNGRWVSVPACSSSDGKPGASSSSPTPPPSNPPAVTYNGDGCGSNATHYSSTVSGLKVSSHTSPGVCKCNSNPAILWTWVAYSPSKPLTNSIENTACEANPTTCIDHGGSYLNGICVAGNLVKGITCWLSTQGPSYTIYNADKSPGTCYEFAKPGVQGTGPTTYYNGVSGKNVRCFIDNRVYNNIQDCEKL